MIRLSFNQTRLSPDLPARICPVKQYRYLFTARADEAAPDFPEAMAWMPHCLEIIVMRRQAIDVTAYPDRNKGAFYSEGNSKVEVDFYMGRVMGVSLRFLTLEDGIRERSPSLLTSGHVKDMAAQIKAVAPDRVLFDHALQDLIDNSPAPRERPRRRLRRVAAPLLPAPA